MWFLTPFLCLVVEEWKMAKKDGYQREKHMTSVFVLFTLCHIGLLITGFALEIPKTGSEGISGLEFH